MDLSDEQIIVKAWEVAVRRGWEFVIISLLRGGVDLSPRGLAGESTDFFSSGKSDCDTVMASQESSEEEEEEEDSEEAPCEPSSIGAGKEGGSWRKLVVHHKSYIASKSLMVDPELKLRTQLFVSKAKAAFAECFSRKEKELDFTSSARSTEGSRVHAETRILHTSAAKVAPPSFSQTSTLKPNVGHISSRFISRLGDGSPGSGLLSVAVVKPTALTLVGTAEEFLLPVNLSAHVSKELRETVVALRFFDMFSLLPAWSVDNLPASSRSLLEWQKGFSIMGSILLEDAPDKMKGYFNYGEIINKAHEAMQGDAWLKYDEEFRRLKETQPDMSWAIIHSQLWLQIIPPAVAALKAQKKTNEGQSMFSASDESSKMNLLKEEWHLPKKLVKGTCLRYNNGVCIGAICNFLHCCSICGALHPKFKCPKKSDDGENPQPLKKQQLG